MSKYTVEITGINTNDLPLLTNEEMNELFIKYHNGDNLAKEELITGNLRLVLSILKKYNNQKYNLDDLFQIGVIGLTKAVINFDLSFGCLFSTYAVPLIVGEIKRYIRDNTTLRISRSIKDNALRILKFKEEYINNYGYEPNKDIISKNLGIKDYDIAIRPLYADSDNVISLYGNEKNISIKLENNYNIYTSYTLLLIIYILTVLSVCYIINRK